MSKAVLSAPSYIVGVDVGTGSARAAVFDTEGGRLSLTTCPIQMWKPYGEFAEQSSDDIWQAVGMAVRQAVADAGASPFQICGIGYAATCSLVVLDKQDRPLSVSPEGDAARNIIVWMDHRAVEEAEHINHGSYEPLKYVGGKISPEMEIPKLLWLKHHLPETFAAAGRFLDLADFLGFQSTGTNIRSECTTVCKWTYLAHQQRWDEEFLRAIGLPELPDGRIGLADDIKPIGSLAGRLSALAAAHLGLAEGTAVAVGAIDAHAGGIGLLGAAGDTGASRATEQLSSALALIGGTSTCHMAASPEPHFIPGVWGPYFGAMVPGLWLTEGGQSASGALLDFIISTHPALPKLDTLAVQSGQTPYQILNARVAALAIKTHLPCTALLTRDLHLLDYHMGNRSPFADPRARGVVDGLTLDSSLDSLAVLYLAAVQAIAYGTRAIVEVMNRSGYQISQMLATGGGTKNPLWLQEHADAVGLPLKLTREPEAVLLGAAILGAVAGSAHSGIPAAMQAMTHAGSSVIPEARTKAYHDAKYQCYQSLYQEHLTRRARMAVFV